MYNGGDTRAIVDLAWWMAEGNRPRLNGHPGYPGGVETFGYWAFKTPNGIIATQYHHAGPTLFVTPVLVLLQWLGIQIPATLVSSFVKILASLMIAGTAWCLWRVMTLYFGSAVGLAGALLFSLGSPAYGVLSQGLFIQTGAIFSQGLSMALVLVLLHRLDSSEKKPPERVMVWGALLFGGFFSSWAAICRPTFAVWTLLFALVVLWRLRARAWVYLLGGAIGGVFGLCLLKYSTGSWIGQWGSGKVGEIGTIPSAAAIVEALAGFWVSPARGLLIFCPWLVVFFAGIGVTFRTRGHRNPLFWCNLLFCIAVYGAVVTFSQWYAGWSGGPRLQSDLLLSALFLSGPALQRVVKRWSFIALLALLLVPAAWLENRWAVVHHDHSWEAYTPSLSKDIWKWKNGQLDWYWTQGAIERNLRGETRDPLLTQPVIEAAQPDVERFFESGIKMNKKENYFQLCARRACFALNLPEAIRNRDLVIESEIWDSNFYGFYREVDISINGHSLGTVRFISGGSRKKSTLSIPASWLNGDPYNRLVLRDRNPPLISVGASFARLGALRVLTADSPLGKAALDQAAGATPPAK